MHWINTKYASDINEMTDLSKDLRTQLNDRAYLSDFKLRQTQESTDGTRKFLFVLEDGQTIESVLIPDGEQRLTLCISSQVGCAMKCDFCATGQSGLIRNLKAYEIVDQVITVNRILEPERKITNVVLMGMGEPLANLDEVTEALVRMIQFIGISKNKITVSTVGLAPQILLFGKQGTDVNLAVSLNASTDEVRSRLMPINKKYPIKTLLDACKKYSLGRRKRIFFEYVLIAGINDSPEDAERLVQLLRGIRCKINLISLNPYGRIYQRPDEKRVLDFHKILLKKKMTVFTRKSKGADILAACGQLKADMKNPFWTPKCK